MLIPFADVVLSTAPNNLSSAAAAVLAQCRHCRTPTYLLSAANFAVAMLLLPLTSLLPPTSNIAAAVYVDAVSSAANKNSHGSPPPEVVDAKLLTPPLLPSLLLNSGESNIV